MKETQTFLFTVDMHPNSSFVEIRIKFDRQQSGCCTLKITNTPQSGEEIFYEVLGIGNHMSHATRILSTSSYFHPHQNQFT